jgi:hypothetical protein
MSALLLAASLLAASPLVVEVFVPLCDGAVLQCGRGSLGDPASLKGNLYWGARYGAGHFLPLLPGYRVVETKEGRGPVLQDLTLRRQVEGQQTVEVLLHAYQGAAMPEALRDFLVAAAGNTAADLVVWAGHDGLMDLAAPAVTRGPRGKPVVALACLSARFMAPAIREVGGVPLVMTRSLMAPEAYLLDALVSSVAVHGVEAPREHRQALVASYAAYQKIGMRAAGSVFSAVP